MKKLLVSLLIGASFITSGHAGTKYSKNIKVMRDHIHGNMFMLDAKDYRHNQKEWDAMSNEIILAVWSIRMEKDSARLYQKNIELYEMRRIFLNEIAKTVFKMPLDELQVITMKVPDEETTENKEHFLLAMTFASYLPLSCDDLRELPVKGRPQSSLFF